MNAKYVFALILALQVSASLCDEPSPDLLEKYNNMKNTFKMRILKLAEKTKETLNARMEGNENAAAAQKRLAELQESPEFKAFIEVAQNVYAEATPAVDSARGAMLSTYEKYLRSHIGQYLSDGIDVIKAYLDKVMPAQ